MISSIKFDDLNCFHEMLMMYVVSWQSKPFSQKRYQYGFTFHNNIKFTKIISNDQVWPRLLEGTPLGSNGLEVPMKSPFPMVSF